MVKEPQIAMDMTEEEEITCQLTKNNELVISGTGAVTEQEIEAVRSRYICIIYQRKDFIQTALTLQRLYY